DRGGECLTPQGGLDDVLDVSHSYVVTGGRLAVDVDVDVAAAGDPLGHHVGSAGDRLQKPLGLYRQILQHVKVRAHDLDPQVGAHPGGEHVDAVYDRLGPAVAHTGLLELAVKLRHDVCFGYPLPPLFPGFQDDDALEHGDRRRIGGGFGPADLAENMLDLGQALDDRVLHLDEALGLGDGDVGERD